MGGVRRGAAVPHRHLGKAAAGGGEAPDSSFCPVRYGGATAPRRHYQRPARRPAPLRPHRAAPPRERRARRAGSAPPPPPPLGGSGRRVSSMLGSPGRLIDLDQEYSAGASARTAAGGTPQVPLASHRTAPRLTRAAARPLSSGGGAAPGRSPQAEGPPGTPAPHPPPPGGRGGDRQRLRGPRGHRSPLRACGLRGAARAEEPSPLAGGLLEGGGQQLLFISYKSPF